MPDLPLRKAGFQLWQRNKFVPPGATNLARWVASSLLVGDPGFEVLSYAVGLVYNDCSVIGREGFVGGFSKEGEPALEVRRVEWELKVFHHGVAFVATGGEENGGPEVFEKGEVIGPVVDDCVEDGSDVGVLAYLGVEVFYECADFGFGDFCFSRHDRFRSSFNSDAAHDQEASGFPISQWWPNGSTTRPMRQP